MRPIIVFLLLGVATGALARDYLWFERNWISDAETTIAARPEFRKAPSETQEKLRSLFGKLRWRVADGILTVEYPDGQRNSDPYFIRAIDEESFEMMSYGGDLMYTILRRSEGFCIEAEGGETTEPLVVECFAPDGA